MATVPMGTMSVFPLSFKGEGQRTKMPVLSESVHFVKEDNNFF